ALKLAAGFGAGLSYRAEICGAVSGALMVIGLHHGYSSPGISNAKDLSYKITKEFLTIFEKKHGSLICKQLLQSDLSTPEGYDHCVQQKLFRTICPALVESASLILESLLEKYQEKG
ncbi:MAG: C-GCAxxG-C-C family protein, partial [Bacteroidetes bacterium]|nr:C-GCAxxG-C-C family protein [Bacteroidota bacterium]